MLGLAQEDIIINVQGDQPLIDPCCLEEVIMPFFNNSEIQMSTLAFKIVNRQEISDSNRVKLIWDRNYFAIYFSRSTIPFGRDISTIFNTYKHIGVYAYTQKFLNIFRNLPEGRLENIEKLEQLRALEYGYKIKVIMTEHDSPTVDVPQDIARIEAILNNKKVRIYEN